MRPGRVAVLLALFAASGLSAQEVVIGSSGQGFSFGDPSGVGLRSYRVVTTSLAVAVPVGPTLAFGLSARWGSAAMGAPGSGEASLAGLTDVDLVALVRAGPVDVRAAYVLPTGDATLTSEATVVASLAAYEFLPFPIRTWSRGGGYALGASLPFRTLGLQMELFGDLSSHGTFEPFDDDPLEYHIGREARFGARLSRRPSALSLIRVEGEVVLTDPDEANGIEIFEPGQRASIGVLVGFPMGRTAVLTGLRFETRREGLSLDAVVPPFDQPMVGVVTSDPRLLIGGQMEARTRVGRAVLIASARGRVIRGEEDRQQGWLAALGLGTEIEVPGPWPGRSFVTPTARVHTGNFTVMAGYASSLRAWELAVTARWEAPR